MRGAIMAVSTSEIQRSLFNPNEHIMQIGKGDKAKDYLPVQWRLVWFRSLFPQGQIETEAVLLDLETEFTVIESKWNNNRRCYEDVPKTAKGIAIFKAKVSDGMGGVATGTKSEKAASFDDFIEKAETGAIGRALAALGYGTQFTGDEWDEAHRIVDSPVDNDKSASPKPEQPKQLPAKRPPMAPSGPLAKPEQITNIRTLIAEQKPQGKATLEDLYASIIKKRYPGDDALPIGEWARLYREVRPKEQAAS